MATAIAKTIRHIKSVNLSFIPVLPIFKTALNMSTHTQTLIPAKASLTALICENSAKNEAITAIIIIEGDIKPSVEIILPTMPFFLYPINVDTFTAITPGVH